MTTALDTLADAQMSNEQRSQSEVREFIANPPAKYFLYIKLLIPGHYRAEATTWMGDLLGAARLGSRYRSNMGDYRRAVTIRAVNGRTYVGTFFESAGDYARVRLAKTA